MAVGHKWNDSNGRLDYVIIATTGNAQEFGGLMPRHDTGAMTGSTVTRGFFAGGYSPGAPEAGRNEISYFLWATKGNSRGFGELTAHRWETQGGSAASPTRIVWMGNGGGANSGGENHIDYTNPNTEGNAVDFGTMLVARFSYAAMTDSVRGVWGGGDGSPTQFNNIDYFNIETGGDCVDFGDLLALVQQTAGCSNGHGGL